MEECNHAMVKVVISNPTSRSTKNEKRQDQNIQGIKTIIERYNSKKSSISACVLCNGCDENQIDSARIRDFFINNGVKSAFAERFPGF